eukprot:RCo042455
MRIDAQEKGDMKQAVGQRKAQPATSARQPLTERQQQAGPAASGAQLSYPSKMAFDDTDGAEDSPVPRDAADPLWVSCSAHTEARQRQADKLSELLLQGQRNLQELAGMSGAPLVFPVPPPLTEPPPPTPPPPPPPPPPQLVQQVQHNKVT